jgi:transcription elongation factor GreA
VDDANVITAEGLAALKANLAELEGEGRRDIASRIKTAREWGDLKENSEYHDAKNEQAHLETKIARLRERISRAVVVEDEHSSGDVVSFGSTVTVRDEAGKEQTWTIVSSHEAQASAGRLSAESPVARALTGRRAGEQAIVETPRGRRTFSVVTVD